MKAVAIDPYGCGCTECIVGEYVPLADATPDQIAAMFAGRLGNNTGLEFTVTASGKFDDRPRRPLSLADADTVTISAKVWQSWADDYRELTWEINPETLRG